MRHPAAPAIVAVLLGLLAVLMLWGKLRGDGHHEGNPDPKDVPRKNEVLRMHGEHEEEEEEEEKKEEKKRKKKEKDADSN